MADDQQLLNLVAIGREAILAGVSGAGYPHLTNVLYVWDAAERIARVSTTADRVKAKVLRRDPRAALHVPGPNFWAYAVAECDAEVSEVATTPGDDVCRELLEVHSALLGEQDEDEIFFAKMIEARRLIVRLRLRRLYGLVRD
jgi:PPOX class probable F420-dependent enzyme